MNRFEIRWKNFRGFKDTKWLNIRPITIIIGANASGKTSLIAPLLLLKQTLESSDTTLPLKTIGEYFNAGSFKDMVLDHNTHIDLSLGLRFRKGAPKRKETLQGIGAYPPGELEVSFSASKNVRVPVLSHYIVRDIYGRTMLARSRLKSGKYSIRGIKLAKQGKGFHEVIRKTMPERFLFTAEGPFKERVESLISEQRGEKGKGKARKLNLNLAEEEDKYFHVVSFTKAFVDRIFDTIYFLGPLSEHPHRMYEILGEIPQFVGTKGEFAPEILFRQRNKPLMNQINKWVTNFDLGFHINCNELTDGAFNITLSRKKSSSAVNLADTGFGLSQILPLVVQGFYSKPNSLIIAEQPEIHLNPKLQTMLADLFSEFVKRKVGVLVETHSEHLLLRIRRLVAEKAIKQSDVALYYTEKDDGKTAIREIQIEENGHIKTEDWPKRFFGESLKESLGLATAQRQSKNANAK
jgi:predicted ATPase